MAHFKFQWDASPTPEVDYYRLYEDGELVVDNIGVLNFDLLLDSKPEGSYDYYVTAVDAESSAESVPSNTVTGNFIMPKAPTNLRVSFVA